MPVLRKSTGASGAMAPSATIMPGKCDMAFGAGEACSPAGGPSVAFIVRLHDPVGLGKSRPILLQECSHSNHPTAIVPSQFSGRLTATHRTFLKIGARRFCQECPERSAFRA